MKKINCVYSSNKYVLNSKHMRDTFEDHFYFDAKDFFKRISKEDDTEKKLSRSGANAYIYKKMQRALVTNDYDVIFYVFRNLEKGVVRDIFRTIKDIHGSLFEFNLFLLSKEKELIHNVPEDIAELFENLLIYNENTRVIFRRDLGDSILK